MGWAVAARETSAACWRTAKSCRSGAAMLASSLREEAQATVSNKPGHRGEREVSRKTIARGMPGRSGVTMVTMLVCFVYFAREAAGALGARHSLRPLISESGTSMAKTRTHRAARTRTYVSRHCEERSDESIHLTSRQTWIASRSPSSGSRSRDPLARNDARSLRRDRQAVAGTAPPRQSKIHGIQVLTFAIR